MLLGDGALSAFQAAAGIAPDKLSVLIRTVLLAFVFLWAAWCVYGEINYFRHHEIEIDLTLLKLMRILFIVTLMIALVFI